MQKVTVGSKRKRENWDFGESVDLYNMEQEDISKHLSTASNRPLIQLTKKEEEEDEKEIPDLIQRNRAVFVIERDKRLLPSTTTSAKKTTTATATTTVIREIELFLPDFLREKVWKRHGYSLQDVLVALRACPKEYIWQLALYYNVPILNSASRASSTFIIRGGKSSAIDRMHREFKRTSLWSTTNPSVLLPCESHYKDPMHLPFHFISRTDFTILAELLPTADPVKTFGQPVRRYRHYVQWFAEATEEPIQLVPLGVYWKVLPDYDFILVNRILPYEAYCAKYHQNTSQTPLSEWTDFVVVGANHKKYAILDEAFYVVCLRS